jgi:hypothetical protein
MPKEMVQSRLMTPIELDHIGRLRIALHIQLPICLGTRPEIVSGAPFAAKISFSSACSTCKLASDRPFSSYRCLLEARQRPVSLFSGRCRQSGVDRQPDIDRLGVEVPTADRIAMLPEIEKQPFGPALASR